MTENPQLGDLLFRPWLGDPADVPPGWTYVPAPHRIIWKLVSPVDIGLHLNDPTWFVTPPYSEHEVTDE